jgi:Ca-activated chloride channel family protein
VMKEALGAGQRFRRHLPPLLFLLALAVMIAAVARPAAIVTLPTQQETIILAMDVSGSMRAADVEPSRLVAAQDAAKAFLADLPRGVRVGVVSFAGTAAVVQPKTSWRPSIGSSCNAAPPSGAGSSSRSPPSSPTPAST